MSYDDNGNPEVDALLQAHRLALRELPDPNDRCAYVAVEDLGRGHTEKCDRRCIAHGGHETEPGYLMNWPLGIREDWHLCKCQLRWRTDRSSSGE